MRIIYVLQPRGLVGGYILLFVFILGTDSLCPDSQTVRFSTVHDKTQAGLNKTERAYPPAVQIVTQTMTYAEE